MTPASLLRAGIEWYNPPTVERFSLNRSVSYHELAFSNTWGLVLAHSRDNTDLDYLLMKKEWSPTQEAFDCLLAWLDPDRDQAGRKYEEVRGKLTMLFARRGCPVAEELTDEVIDRVTRKCLELAHAYVGDPLLYFCGVAHNVFLEYVKKRPDPHPLPRPESSEEKERYSNCLDACMERLDRQSRELILEYYRDERRAKIDHRKELADSLGVTLNTLRMRAHRIKKTLQQCLGSCLTQGQES